MIPSVKFSVMFPFSIVNIFTSSKVRLLISLYFQYTKFGKVMRHITGKPDAEVPHNDEYKFKDRAQALVNKWHALNQSAEGEVNGKTEGEHKENGIVNGDAVPPTAATALTDEAKDEAKLPEANGDITMTTVAGDVTMSEAVAA